MKNNIDLSVIIPVHSIADQNFDNLLHSALMSIENNETHPSKVIIVRCSCDEVREVLNKLDTSKYSFNIEVIENTEGKQFQKQINFAAKQVTTKYFSFLEFDDEFSVKWLDNVKTYTEAYPDIDMFLPIITDVTSDNNFVGLTNEAAWAFNFSDTLGQIDHDVLLEYPNINPDGMVIKTEVFKTIGGYKPSIKLTFNYEFLLRFTNTGRNIMVIPKMGYKHTNMRPGSLFWEYKNSVDESFRIQPSEAHFWMETAKKEYFFNEDRDITYVEEAIISE
jgi:hypothetical protein